MRADHAFIDIEARLALYPEWKAKSWIPVAGDGCGNYYLLLPDGCVIFLDTQCDASHGRYVVGSSLAHFLVFLFEEELGATGWPFNANYVLQRDPKIEACQCAPMPWHAGGAKS